MTQAERRQWLIRELLREEGRAKSRIPEDAQEQRDMLRALMNVRMPKPISQEFMDIQDEYLSEENKSGGLTYLDDLKPSAFDKRIYLWQGDITTLVVDAIVNAANSQLCGCFQPLHSCIDNIIHSKAGLALRDRCYQLMRAQGHEEPTGQAKITPAYNLPCRYVIHTVGPIVQGRLTREHEALLASCYRSCLELAAEYGLTSIAFCCISTGVFCFPNEQAAKIAIRTVRAYLDETGSGLRVVFNVFQDADLAIYQELLRL